MVFQTASLLDKVDQAKSNDWPDGLTKHIIARLKRDYQPINRISRVEITRKLNEASIKNNDDPKVIFEQISTIKIIMLV